jgi:hypothetical protein
VITVRSVQSPRGGICNSKSLAAYLLRIAVVVASMATPFLSPTASADEAFAASFTDGSFHLSGVSRGGDVIVFGIWRERIDIGHGHTTVERKVLTASGSEVTFESQRMPPPASLWIFVDQKSGQFLLTTPSGPAAVRPLPVEAIETLVADDRGSIAVRLAAADVLVVTPGDSAWLDTIFDGGTTDDRPLPDGVAKCTAEKLKPFKGNKKKDKLKKDDVLIVIDPFTQRVAAVRVK